MKKIRWKWTALAVMLLASSLTRGVMVNYPPPCSDTGFNVNSFTVNQQLILEIYNTIDQTSNTVQRYPAGMPLNVLGMSVTNTYSQPRKMRFRMRIKESNKLWAWVGPISTINPIPGNSTVTLDASAFELSAADLATFQNTTTNPANESNTAFGTGYNEVGIENELGNFSNLNDASSLLSKNFQICIVPMEGGTLESNNACQACTFLSLLAPAAGANCNVPTAVWPRNNSIPNSMPTFVWTPAYSTDCPRNAITYRLEVMEGSPQSAPVVRVNIPAGVATYTWNPSDRVLEPGVKYFWRIIALCKGKTFCGPSGRGWDIVKWFKLKDTKTECRYTLKEVLDYVDRLAPANIKEELKNKVGKLIAKPSGNNHQFICDLLAGRIAATGWKLKKK